MFNIVEIITRSSTFPLESTALALPPLPPPLFQNHHPIMDIMFTFSFSSSL